MSPWADTISNGRGTINGVPIPEGNSDPPDSWRPVDLGPYIRGDITPPVATVGMTRSDGIRLVYPGLEHAVIGETESGKSWFSLACTATELVAGNHVVYIHFEEASPAGTIERLQLLAVPDAIILDRFRFVAPARKGDTASIAALLDPTPTLVVLDGVTEAIGMNGWSEREDGIANYRRHLARPCTSVGAAVLSCDHVTKNPETRGRMALGSVHKINGLSGAQIILESIEPFGRDRRGRSNVYIGKDRPGTLRAHGTPTKITGKTFMGTLTVNHRTCGPDFHLAFYAPSTETVQDTSSTPTTLADNIHHVISHLDDHAVRSERALLAQLRAANITARDNAVRDAVDDLIAAGRLIETIGPNRARGYRAIETECVP